MQCYNEVEERCVGDIVDVQLEGDDRVHDDVKVSCNGGEDD